MTFSLIWDFRLRVLGFVGMVLVLWSPVAVPLLPTLVQSWATKTHSVFAELACIIGLYTAIMILVMIWGKRIRGYENPLEQYGLDLTSLSKVWIEQNLFCATSIFLHYAKLDMTVA